jgi:hypothetical protein
MRAKNGAAAERSLSVGLTRIVIVRPPATVCTSCMRLRMNTYGAGELATPCRPNAVG